MVPTDDPELLEQFDGNLEDAEASAAQVFATASFSFQEAHELLSRVKSERGYYLVVGIGAINGLAQPTGDRKLAKSQGKVKKGKRKCNPSPYKGGTAMDLGMPWKLPNPLASRSESDPSKLEKRQLKLPRIVVDLITHLGCVLINTCCVVRLDIVHLMVPKHDMIVRQQPHRINARLERF